MRKPDARNSSPKSRRDRVIETYLPQAASTEEIEQAVTAAIAETGASSMKDMGKVMKAAQAALAGKNADGRVISEVVKAKLTGG